MPISINGTGSITGLSAGGLPDASITADDIASNAITTAKVNDAAITTAKVNDAAVTYGKLSNSATDSDNVRKRVALAWTSNDGSGASFNVSSVQFNTPSTGVTRVNFTSNIGTSYVAIGNVGNKTTDGGACHANNWNTAYCDFFNKVQGQPATNWGRGEFIIIGQ